MQLSEKQLAANRSNALKSHGPRNPGSPRTSSRQAVSHGFLATSILLPGESRERFLRLIGSLTTEYDPFSPTDFMMIETMSVNRWRTLRNWTVETAGLIHEQRAQSETNSGENPPTQTALALQSLARPPRSQETLSRYEVRYDRQFHRAAEYLLRSRARREEKQAKSIQADENKQNCPHCNPILSANEAQSKPD